MKLTLVIAEVFIISLFSIICLNGLGELKKLSDQVEKTGKTAFASCSYFFDL